MFPTRPVLPGEASPTACSAVPHSRGGTSVSTAPPPRDKRQQKLIRCALLLFAHLLGPPPNKGPRSPDRTNYFLTCCLPALSGRCLV